MSRTRISSVSFSSPRASRRDRKWTDLDSRRRRRPTCLHALHEEGGQVCSGVQHSIQTLFQPLVCKDVPAGARRIVADSCSSPTSNPTYKPSQYNFPSNQIWCAPGDSLSFVDEGQGLQNAYESRSDSNVEGYAVSSPSARAEEQPLSILPPPNSHIRDHHRALDLAITGEPSNLDSYNWSASDDGQQEKPSPTVGSEISVMGTNEQPTLYQDVSMWPLNDATEARLLRYFIDYVSRRFDLCDPNKHFALVVPCRAAVCPPLMDAAFALSARYLSRTTDFDEYIADRYYQRCLNSLVPMFGDPEALLNRDLFAAIVVLRTLEEIEGEQSPSSFRITTDNHSSIKWCRLQNTPVRQPPLRQRLRRAESIFSDKRTFNIRPDRTPTSRIPRRLSPRNLHGVCISATRHARLLSPRR